MAKGTTTQVDPRNPIGPDGADGWRRTCVIMAASASPAAETAVRRFWWAATVYTATKNAKKSGP